MAAAARASLERARGVNRHSLRTTSRAADQKVFISLHTKTYLYLSYCISYFGILFCCLINDFGHLCSPYHLL